MLPTVVFPMLAEIVAFVDAGLQPEVNLLDRQRPGIGDATLTRRLFQVSPVTDLTSMVAKEGAVNLSPPYPYQRLRGKRNSTRLNFLALLFRISHIGSQFRVQPIEPSCEGSP